MRLQFLILLLPCALAADPAHHYSAVTAASGPHSTAFANNISGIAYNPAGISVTASPQVLLTYGVTASNLTVLRTALLAPVGTWGLFGDLGWTFSKDIQVLEPRVGVGWGHAWFHTGACLAWGVTFPKDRPEEHHLRPELGLILAPGPLRLGLTTVFPRPGEPESRAQVGVLFFDGRVQLSSGLLHRWHSAAPPTPNAALDLYLQDFLNLSLCLEGPALSGGISFNSYSARLGFGIRHESAGRYTTVLSFNIQR